jgi:hypothetical protein
MAIYCSSTIGRDCGKESSLLMQYQVNAATFYVSAINTQPMWCVGTRIAKCGGAVVSERSEIIFQPTLGNY